MVQNVIFYVVVFRCISIEKCFSFFYMKKNCLVLSCELRCTSQKKCIMYKDYGQIYNIISIGTMLYIQLADTLQHNLLRIFQFHKESCGCVHQCNLCTEQKPGLYYLLVYLYVTHVTTLSFPSVFCSLFKFSLPLQYLQIGKRFFLFFVSVRKAAHDQLFRFVSL